MAERIFPTQPQEQLGSKLVFNGIDIDTLMTKLAETQDDTKKDGLSPELREQIAAMKLNIVTSDKDDDDVCQSCGIADAVEGGDLCKNCKKDTREAKKAIPEAFKAHMFKSKDAKDEEGDEKEGDEGESDVVEGKKAEARRRRIRFTAASQLSPEAAAAAKEQGDEELFNAILAARSDVRVREAQRLISLSEEALKREASSVTKRSAYRMSVVKNVEDTRRAIASTDSKENNSDFKSVKSMTDDERNYFRRTALAKGLPEEYVDNMFAVEDNSSADTSIEASIRDIMASTLAVDTKKAAVGGLVKTAMLDSENIARLKKYWKDDLGYGDEAWIDDLFTTKYDKK